MLFFFFSLSFFLWHFVLRACVLSLSPLPHLPTVHLFSPPPPPPTPRQVLNALFASMAVCSPASSKNPRVLSPSPQSHLPPVHLFSPTPTTAPPSPSIGCICRITGSVLTNFFKGSVCFGPARRTARGARGRFAPVPRSQERAAGCWVPPGRRLTRPLLLTAGSRPEGLWFSGARKDLLPENVSARY